VQRTFFRPFPYSQPRKLSTESGDDFLINQPTPPPFPGLQKHDPGLGNDNPDLGKRIPAKLESWAIWLNQMATHKTMIW
jgi:hypothetical protein